MNYAIYDNTKENNSSDIPLRKPTEEEYKNATDRKSMFQQWLRLCRERKNELLDLLIKERENELTYEREIEKSHDIIRLYEIYAEIEADKKGTDK